MFLKTIGIISRKHINIILRELKIDNNEFATQNSPKVDTSNCPKDCKYRNMKLYSICKNACKYNMLIEENSLEENKKKRLSHIQILQYLLYHFLPLTSEGEYKFLLEKDIATTLGCSIRTVKRNNEVLKAYGLINYSYDDYGLISLSIKNYKDSFKKKSEKGTGGVSIPFNFMQMLIKLKSIDELRFAIFMFEKYISYESQYGPDEFKEMALNKFRFLLSKGKQYKKKILEIIDKLIDLFKFSKESVPNKTIKFKLDNLYLAKNFKIKQQKYATEKIMNIINDKKIDTTLTDIDDLLSLTLQYGTIPVINILNKYKVPIKNTKNKLGAIIRKLLLEDYWDKIGVEF